MSTNPTLGALRSPIVDQSGMASRPFERLMNTWARQLANLGNMIFASPMTIQGVQVFADNAAALAGGLTAGQLYRTGADPDVIAIVHL